MRPLTSSSAPPGFVVRFSTLKRTGRPTIISARSASVAVFGSPSPTILPSRSTLIRSATSSTSLQLVGDEDQRLAGVAERPDDAEELGHLLRRQHRRRLVEDEHARRAEQHLDDLDALLQADRHLLDDRVGVDLEAVLGADRAHLLARLVRCRGGRARRVGSTPSTTFSATVNTGTSMKCWCTMPMPAWIASLASRKCDRLAVDEDFALVGPVEAAEDVHQGGFAGAVFAEQAEDFAGPDFQVDVGVGDDLAEALGDAAQLDVQDRTSRIPRLALSPLLTPAASRCERGGQCRRSRAGLHSP